MKKQVIPMTVAAVFFLALSINAVSAQDAGTMSVNIPFAFVVANKTLPAGEYQVRRNILGSSVQIQIRQTQSSRSMYLPIHVVTGTEIQAESKLVFNRYGDQYFLSQVWTAGRSNAEELATTSRERTLLRDLAGRAAKAETITIAGRP